MPLDFELIFRLSLAASAALLALVAFLTLTLIAIKAVRQVWQKYRRRREVYYRPAVLQAISGGPPLSGAADLRSPSRIGDRVIVEGLLLQWGRSVKGEAHDRLCVAFREAGFTDDELERLKSRRWWIRASAARKLGLMRCEKAAPDLVISLEDASLDVRLAAAWALGRLGDWPAAASIVQALAHHSRLRRCASPT